MISFVYLLLIFITSNKFSDNTFAVVLAIVTGSVFITSLLLRNLLQDIFNEVKYIHTYVITEKLSYQDDEPGLGGLVMKFYLITENKRFSVSEEQYNLAEIGDIIQEHESPKTFISLHMEIKKRSSDCSGENH